MTEPLTQHQIISGKIAELSEKLLANHPQMPLLLREIHQVLKNDPAIVTLLSPEEVSKVINGLERQTNTYIAQSMTAPKGAKKAALKNTSAADLGFD